MAELCEEGATTRKRKKGKEANRGRKFMKN